MKVSKPFFKALLLFLFMGICLTACGQNNRKAAADAESGGKEAVSASAAVQVEKLTCSDFEKKVAVLNAEEWNYLGEKPCIIDFYADWCGPCKQLSPILDKAVASFGGKVLLYKINVDEEGKLAAAFGVRSIPMLLFVPMKGDPQISVGLVDEATIISAARELFFTEPSVTAKE